VKKLQKGKLEKKTEHESTSQISYPQNCNSKEIMTYVYVGMDHFVQIRHETKKNEYFVAQKKGRDEGIQFLITHFYCQRSNCEK
jgi:hypothetical protein